jgi:sugar phosphate isomerase/epimerase
MTHPRLSVHEICTWPIPFGDELKLWDELEIRNVGLMGNKVDEYGRAEAISALSKRDIGVATITTGAFNLAEPDSWDATRASFRDAIDLAAEVGGCVYTIPGRRDGRRTFDDLAEAFTRAIEPAKAYAESKGVALAVEPSLRTDVSFANSLRDGLILIERAGVGIIADLGNCWTERDVPGIVREAGPRIAAVQFADALYGTSAQPSPGGRAVPGDGDLAIDEFFRAALDAGYTGPFELEMVGPLIIDEGHIEATRRGVKRASAILDGVLGTTVEIH